MYARWGRSFLLLVIVGIFASRRGRTHAYTHTHERAMMKRREAEKRTGAGKGATPIFSHKWVWWACGHGCQRMNTLQPCYTSSSSSISAATCFSKESEHTTPFHTMRVISKGSMVLVEQRYVPSPAPTTTTTTTIVVVTNYALQCHKYLL